MIYREVQFGWLVAIPCSFFVMLTVYIGLSHDDTEPIPWQVLLPIVLVMIFAIILFYKFEVEVDSDQIRISYGIGLIRKSFELADIASVEAVRNKWYYGLGIRILPGGNLYNIHGLEAVELKFTDSTRWVRIGASNGTHLAKAIEDAIQ